jgi:GNAT superfamily N-acetyltransferase
MQHLRPCGPADLSAMLAIINAAAEAYRGVIPRDCFHDPYMPEHELQRELAAGVEFLGCESDGELIGVMGLQDVGDVALIRHAYVRPAAQGTGVGAALLGALLRRTARRVLVGTWADAGWAIRFYERHGFVRVPAERAAALLARHWDVSGRQVETSVVLARPAVDSDSREMP